MWIAGLILIIVITLAFWFWAKGTGQPSTFWIGLVLDVIVLVVLFVIQVIKKKRLRA